MKDKVTYQFHTDEIHQQKMHLAVTNRCPNYTQDEYELKCLEVEHQLSEIFNLIKEVPCFKAKKA